MVVPVALAAALLHLVLAAQAKAASAEEATDRQAEILLDPSRMPTDRKEGRAGLAVVVPAVASDPRQNL